MRLAQHADRDDLAVAREHGVGARQLEQRGRQAVAIAHGRLFDGPPGLVRAQLAADRARETDLRPLPQADGREQLVHLARLHLHRELGGADVAGHLDHLPHADDAMRLGVADDGTLEGVFAVAGVDEGVGRDAMGFQCQAGDEGLHRRARFEHIGQRAVAQLLAGEVLPVAGVVAREVGQGQHLAALHIQHDDRARLGLVFGDGIADALVGKELHLGVHRQIDVLAVGGRHDVADVLDHAAQAVAHDGARAVPALQLLLERELDALLALVRHVGEADHMGRGLALGVFAAVFAVLKHALQSKRLHLRGGLVVGQALEPDKARLGVELGLQFGRRQPQRLGQRLPLVRIGVDLFRDGPDRRHGDAGRQGLAAAVVDATPAGRQLQRVCIAGLALLLEKVGVQHLHVDGTREQPEESQSDQGNQEARAPGRRLGGQQRAGGIADHATGAQRPRARARLGAAHGDTPEATSAGVITRMPRRSRATCSTRRLVAWAWRSAARR
mmetsp:Transcript_5866/g.23095  ORF Transcript_5866/g.23095 Transcript_5866/m.23095 type:complete len:499 (-) Transcript_5866:703-2199(-)